MANIKLKTSSVTGKVPLTTDLAYGELALNYTDKKLYFKSSTNSIENFTVGTGTGTQYDRQPYTATAGQTTFTVGYDLVSSVPLVQVFINGVLIDKTEYTATNGTSIVLSTGTSLGDLVECIGFKNFYIATLATSGSGLSYSIATGVITLNSDTAATANTVALRDSTGTLSAAGINLSNLTFDGINLSVKPSTFGIYPFTYIGSTNSTIYSSLIVNPTVSFSGNNGLSNTSYQNFVSTANIKNDGTGGALQVAGVAANFSSYVESTATTGRVSSNGVNINNYRSSATDLSTVTTNTMAGLTMISGHIGTTLPATTYTNTNYGATFATYNQAGIVNAQYGVVSNVFVGNAAASPNTSVTTLRAFSNTNFTIGTAATSVGATATVANAYGMYFVGPSILANATVSNYYGIYLEAATVTGTLTNRYGIWQNDSLSTNYFAGPTTVQGLTVGKGSGAVATNSAFGTNALSGASTGVHGTGIGYNAQVGSNANDNTSVGYIAGQSLTSGGANTLIGSIAGQTISTGTNNVAVGTSALQAATTSSSNTAVGYQAAYSNISIRMPTKYIIA